MNNLNKIQLFKNNPTAIFEDFFDEEFDNSFFRSQNIFGTSFNRLNSLSKKLQADFDSIIEQEEDKNQQNDQQNKQKGYFKTYNKIINSQTIDGKTTQDTLIYKNENGKTQKLKTIEQYEGNKLIDQQKWINDEPIAIESGKRENMIHNSLNNSFESSSSSGQCQCECQQNKMINN